MKKQLAFLIILLYTFPAIAQIGNIYGNSIGVRVFNVGQMPKILNQTNSQEYVNTYANGVFVKFIDNQISYRFSAAYFNDNISFYNQCQTCQTAEGKRTDYSFKAGFEKSFNYSLIQPYFGFDLGYRADNFSGGVTNIQPGSSQPYTVETIKTGVTLSPIIGLRVNFAKQLSLYAEGNLDFYYAYERRETVEQANGSPTILNRFTRLEYLLNPISLGVQFHFGNKNQ